MPEQYKISIDAQCHDLSFDEDDSGMRPGGEVTMQGKAMNASKDAGKTYRGGNHHNNGSGPPVFAHHSFIKCIMSNIARKTGVD